MDPDQLHAQLERQRTYADYLAAMTGERPQPAAPGTVVTWRMSNAEMMAACTGLPVKCFEKPQAPDGLRQAESELK